MRKRQPMAFLGEHESSDWLAKLLTNLDATKLLVEPTSRSVFVVGEAKTQTNYQENWKLFPAFLICLCIKISFFPAFALILMPVRWMSECFRDVWLWLFCSAALLRVSVFPHVAHTKLSPAKRGRSGKLVFPQFKTRKMLLNLLWLLLNVNFIS
jgi:hypothetical protein